MFENIGQKLSEMDIKDAYFIIGYLSCLENQSWNQSELSEDDKDRLMYYMHLLDRNPAEFVASYKPDERILMEKKISLKSE